MSKKTKTPIDHTVFRNNAMFCMRCGVSEPLNLPIAVRDLPGIVDAFNTKHIDCKDDWTQPVNTDASTQSEAKNVSWWLQYGEHGLSSEALVHHLKTAGTPVTRPSDDHPWDPDDFRRCHELLQAVPQLRSRLDQMRQVSAVWERLVDHWDQLTTMLLDRNPDMYDLMQTLINHE